MKLVERSFVKPQSRPEQGSVFDTKMWKCSPQDVRMFELGVPLELCFVYKQVIPSETLIRSLSLLLMEYRPFAGRYSRIHESILLNDKGVRFEMYDSASHDIHRVVQDHNNPSFSTAFIFSNPKSRGFTTCYRNASLMYIRLTRLRGGGCVLGVSVCHGLCDGESLGHFFYRWSKIATEELVTVERPVSLMVGAEDFEIAKRCLESSPELASSTSAALKLAIYGMYKQATLGDCKESAPSSFNVKAKLKYDAYKANSGLTKEAARKQYVGLIQKIIPNLPLTTSTALSGGALPSNASAAPLPTSPFARSFGAVFDDKVFRDFQFASNKTEARALLKAANWHEISKTKGIMLGASMMRRGLGPFHLHRTPGFHFSRSALDRIKQFAEFNANIKDVDFSTNVVVSSFLCQIVARVFDFEDKHMLSHATKFNWRGRFPAVPNKWFGNATSGLQTCKFPAKASLGEICLLMDKCLSLFKTDANGIVTKHVNALLNSTKFDLLATMNDPKTSHWLNSKPSTVAINNLSGMPLYHVDLGGGKPGFFVPPFTSDLIAIWPSCEDGIEVYFQGPLAARVSKFNDEQTMWLEREMSKFDSVTDSDMERMCSSQSMAGPYFRVSRMNEIVVAPVPPGFPSPLLSRAIRVSTNLDDNKTVYLSKRFDLAYCELDDDGMPQRVEEVDFDY